MTNSIKYLLIFAAGAATGSATTYFLVKGKLDKQYQEDVAEIRAASKYKVPETQEEKQVMADKAKHKADILQYRAKTQEEQTDYTKYYKDDKKPDMTEQPIMTAPEEAYSGPYLISEDEFGDDDELRKKVFATLYLDNKLVADDDDIVIDQEEVGNDNLAALRNEDVDVIHVRNEVTMTDYEIVLDEDHYYDNARFADNYEEEYEDDDESEDDI